MNKKVTYSLLKELFIFEKIDDVENKKNRYNLAIPNDSNKRKKILETQLVFPYGVLGDDWLPILQYQCELFKKDEKFVFRKGISIGDKFIDLFKKSKKARDNFRNLVNSYYDDFDSFIYLEVEDDTKQEEAPKEETPTEQAKTLTQEKEYTVIDTAYVDRQSATEILYVYNLSFDSNSKKIIIDNTQIYPDFKKGEDSYKSQFVLYNANKMEGDSEVWMLGLIEEGANAVFFYLEEDLRNYKGYSQNENTRIRKIKGILSALRRQQIEIIYGEEKENSPIYKFVSANNNFGEIEKGENVFMGKVFGRSKRKQITSISVVSQARFLRLRGDSDVFEWDEKTPLILEMEMEMKSQTVNVKDYDSIANKGGGFYSIKQGAERELVKGDSINENMLELLEKDKYTKALLYKFKKGEEQYISLYEDDKAIKYSDVQNLIESNPDLFKDETPVPNHSISSDYVTVVKIGKVDENWKIKKRIGYIRTNHRVAKSNNPNYFFTKTYDNVFNKAINKNLLSLRYNTSFVEGSDRLIQTALSQTEGQKQIAFLNTENENAGMYGTLFVARKVTDNESDFKFELYPNFYYKNYFNIGQLESLSTEGKSFEKNMYNQVLKNLFTINGNPVKTDYIDIDENFEGVNIRENFRAPEAQDVYGLKKRELTKEQKSIEALYDILNNPEFPFVVAGKLYNGVKDPTSSSFTGKKDVLIAKDKDKIKDFTDEIINSNLRERYVNESIVELINLRNSLFTEVATRYNKNRQMIINSFEKSLTKYQEKIAEMDLAKEDKKKFHLEDVLGIPDQDYVKIKEDNKGDDLDYDASLHDKADKIDASNLAENVNNFIQLYKNNINLVKNLKNKTTNYKKVKTILNSFVGELSNLKKFISKKENEFKKRNIYDDKNKLYNSEEYKKFKIELNEKIDELKKKFVDVKNNRRMIESFGSISRVLRAYHMLIKKEIEKEKDVLDKLKKYPSWAKMSDNQRLAGKNININKLFKMLDYMEYVLKIDMSLMRGYKTRHLLGWSLLSMRRFLKLYYDIKLDMKGFEIEDKIKKLDKKERIILYEEVRRKMNQLYEDTAKIKYDKDAHQKYKDNEETYTVLLNRAKSKKEITSDIFINLIKKKDFVQNLNMYKRMRLLYDKLRYTENEIYNKDPLVFYIFDETILKDQFESVLEDIKNENRDLSNKIGYQYGDFPNSEKIKSSFLLGDSEAAVTKGVLKKQTSLKHLAVYKIAKDLMGKIRGLKKDISSDSDFTRPTNEMKSYNEFLLEEKSIQIEEGEYMVVETPAIIELKADVLEIIQKANITEFTDNKEIAIKSSDKNYYKLSNECFKLSDEIESEDYSITDEQERRTIYVYAPSTYGSDFQYFNQGGGKKSKDKGFFEIRNWHQKITTNEELEFYPVKDFINKYTKLMDSNTPDDTVYDDNRREGDGEEGKDRSRFSTRYKTLRVGIPFAFTIVNNIRPTKTSKFKVISPGKVSKDYIKGKGSVLKIIRPCAIIIVDEELDKFFPDDYIEKDTQLSDDNYPVTIGKWIQRYKTKIASELSKESDDSIRSDNFEELITKMKSTLESVKNRMPAPVYNNVQEGISNVATKVYQLNSYSEDEIFEKTKIFYNGKWVNYERLDYNNDMNFSKDLKIDTTNKTIGINLFKDKRKIDKMKREAPFIFMKKKGDEFTEWKYSINPFIKDFNSEKVKSILKSLMNDEKRVDVIEFDSKEVTKDNFSFATKFSDLVDLAHSFKMISKEGDDNELNKNARLYLGKEIRETANAILKLVKKTKPLAKEIEGVSIEDLENSVYTGNVNEEEEKELKLKNLKYGQSDERPNPILTKLDSINTRNLKLSDEEKIKKLVEKYKKIKELHQGKNIKEELHDLLQKHFYDILRELKIKDSAEKISSYKFCIKDIPSTLSKMFEPGSPSKQKERDMILYLLSAISEYKIKSIKEYVRITYLVMYSFYTYYKDKPLEKEGEIYDEDELKVDDDFMSEALTSLFCPFWDKLKKGNVKLPSNLVKGNEKSYTRFYKFIQNKLEHNLNRYNKFLAVVFEFGDTKKSLLESLDIAEENTPSDLFSLDSFTENVKKYIFNYPTYSNVKFLDKSSGVMCFIDVNNIDDLTILDIQTQQSGIMEKKDISINTQDDAANVELSDEERKKELRDKIEQLQTELKKADPNDKRDVEEIKKSLKELREELADIELNKLGDKIRSFRKAHKTIPSDMKYGIKGEEERLGKKRDKERDEEGRMTAMESIDYSLYEEATGLVNEHDEKYQIKSYPVLLVKANFSNTLTTQKERFNRIDLYENELDELSKNIKHLFSRDTYNEYDNYSSPSKQLINYDDYKGDDLKHNQVLFKEPSELRKTFVNTNGKNPFANFDIVSFIDNSKNYITEVKTKKKNKRVTINYKFKNLVSPSDLRSSIKTNNFLYYYNIENMHSILTPDDIRCLPEDKYTEESKNELIKKYDEEHGFSKVKVEEFYMSNSKANDSKMIYMSDEGYYKINEEIAESGSQGKITYASFYRDALIAHFKDKTEKIKFNTKTNGSISFILYDENAPIEKENVKSVKIIKSNVSISAHEYKLYNRIKKGVIIPEPPKVEGDNRSLFVFNDQKLTKTKTGKIYYEADVSLNKEKGITNNKSIKRSFDGENNLYEFIKMTNNNMRKEEVSRISSITEIYSARAIFHNGAWLITSPMGVDITMKGDMSKSKDDFIKEMKRSKWKKYAFSTNADNTEGEDFSMRHFQEVEGNNFQNSDTNVVLFIKEQKKNKFIYIINPFNYNILNSEESSKYFKDKGLYELSENEGIEYSNHKTIQEQGEIKIYDNGDVKIEQPCVIKMWPDEKSINWVTEEDEKIYLSSNKKEFIDDLTSDEWAKYRIFNTHMKVTKREEGEKGEEDKVTVKEAIKEVFDFNDYIDVDKERKFILEKIKERNELSEISIGSSVRNPEIKKLNEQIKQSYERAGYENEPSIEELEDETYFVKPYSPVNLFYNRGSDSGKFMLNVFNKKILSTSLLRNKLLKFYEIPEEENFNIFNKTQKSIGEHKSIIEYGEFNENGEIDKPCKIAFWDNDKPSNFLIPGRDLFDTEISAVDKNYGGLNEEETVFYINKGNVYSKITLKGHALLGFPVNNNESKTKQRYFGSDISPISDHNLKRSDVKYPFIMYFTNYEEFVKRDTTELKAKFYLNPFLMTRFFIEQEKESGENLTRQFFGNMLVFRKEVDIYNMFKVKGGKSGKNEISSIFNTKNEPEKGASVFKTITPGEITLLNNGKKWIITKRIEIDFGTPENLYPNGLLFDDEFKRMTMVSSSKETMEIENVTNDEEKEKIDIEMNLDFAGALDSIEEKKDYIGKILVRDSRKFMNIIKSKMDTYDMLTKADIEEIIGAAKVRFFEKIETIDMSNNFIGFFYHTLRLMTQRKFDEINKERNKTDSIDKEDSEGKSVFDIEGDDRADAAFESKLISFEDYRLLSKGFPLHEDMTWTDFLKQKKKGL